MTDSVFIAVHHYQGPALAARGDLVADSYRLAVEAARSDARYIVVCGVRFMAESVATLAQPGQIVVHPAPDALCPMADMIDAQTAARTLAKLRSALAPVGVLPNAVIPLTYMNSTNGVKAFTGREGGSICTSGNAKAILSHYLNRGNRVFFMPDANLALNTARELGLSADETAVLARDGAIPAECDLSRVKLFVWDGFCPVHRNFTSGSLKAAREAHPGAKIVVHPECVPAVAAEAEATGSTEGMYRVLESAPPGSTWGIGTEIRFVERMRDRFPDKTIFPLMNEPCADMARVTPELLDAALAAIRERERTDKPLTGDFSPVTVPEAERFDARRALDAMIRIAESAKN